MKISFKELSIYEVEEFHKEILKALELSGEILELDFENIVKIDLCNIQLLISVKKYCDKQSMKLIILNINSKKVKQIFKMFNLYQIMGIKV